MLSGSIATPGGVKSGLRHTTGGKGALHSFFFVFLCPQAAREHTIFAARCERLSVRGKPAQAERGGTRGGAGGRSTSVRTEGRRGALTACGARTTTNACTKHPPACANPGPKAAARLEAVGRGRRGAARPVLASWVVLKGSPETRTRRSACLNRQRGLTLARPTAAPTATSSVYV